MGLFRYTLLPPPPAEYCPPPPSSRSCIYCYQVLTEYIFCESVDTAHNSQISSTFQEADCLLKLIKLNNQVAPKTSGKRNLNRTAQLSISYRGGGIIILSAGLGGGGDYGKGSNAFLTALFTSSSIPHYFRQTRGNVA